MNSNKLEKIFEKNDQIEYEKYANDDYYYPSIISGFNKRLREVAGEELFQLVKFFGGYSTAELLDFYFKNTSLIEDMKDLIHKAEELINYLNNNPEKFTYSSEKYKVNFYKEEWNKTNQISTAWKQMHLFLPAENILSILLYPIYKLDINSFINLWQKIELPFYAAAILYECKVSVNDITDNFFSKVDVVIEKNSWNKKFSSALLLEYVFTQMFYQRRQCALEENIEKNDIEQHIENNNYSSLIGVFCQRSDADFILRNWFKYVVQNWQHLFFKYKKNIPYIISLIVKLIKRTGKDIDVILDLSNATDEDIQPLLLTKIYSEGEYNFDQKYINFLFKSYKNKRCVMVYSVPEFGYLREDISYLGQLLVNLEDPVSVWKNKWKDLEIFRIKSRYELNNYDMLNSSLFHILLGIAAFNYFNQENPSKNLLLDAIWGALKELYFLNIYMNSAHIETLMLYIIFISLNENNKNSSLEKIRFISNNLELFIRIINQNRYTNTYVNWFDDELKQKIITCYKISKLYQKQNIKYIISNKKLLQELGINNV